MRQVDDLLTCNSSELVHAIHGGGVRVAEGGSKNSVVKLPLPVVELLHHVDELPLFRVEGVGVGVDGVHLGHHSIERTTETLGELVDEGTLIGRRHLQHRLLLRSGLVEHLEVWCGVGEDGVRWCSISCVVLAPPEVL